MTRPARAALGAALLSIAAALGGGADARAGGATKAPSIDAPAGILVDAGTGDVLTAKAPNERRPIASATKLMTALLALEHAELDDSFRAPPYEASAVESQIELVEGERLTVRDLLAAILLESANDAAATIATGVSGSQGAFVDEMNRRAGELGLRDTRYANPIGFDDPDNFSSARDLAVLASHLLRDPRFARIVDRGRAVLESGARRRVVANRNRLVRAYPEVDGVKTGHTLAAGYVLVGAATARDAGVVSVVLGASSEQARDRESRELLDYGMTQFHRRLVVEEGQPVATAAVRYRDGDRASLTTSQDVSVTVRRGEGGVTTRVDAPDELEGPLPADSRVGSVEVLSGGDVVETAPLVTAGAVPEAGTLQRVTAGLGGALTWIVASAVVVALALLLLGLRAARRGRTAP